MKALVLKVYNQLVYEDVPEPEYGADEVLVRVKACGICGSDVHGMDGSTGRRIPPLIMGHEASGVIEVLGADVRGWSVGDRVTFDSTIYPLDDWFTRMGRYNLSDGRMVLGVSPGDYRRHGAFAEYVAVPQHILYKIPESVSFEQAAMVEPAAVALHAISLTPIGVNDSAVVVGAGMIGIFVVQLLRVAGCGKIIAVDIAPDKLALACKMGAHVGLNPRDADVPQEVARLTKNRGADVAIEAVGIEQTVNYAVECVRKGGAVTLVGNTSPRVDFPLQWVVTRELRVQGSCSIRGEYEAVLELMGQGAIHPEAILSAVAPLSEGASWFQRLYNQEKGLMKVILQP
jgi:L-iditol 2-dehydrogenase